MKILGIRTTYNFIEKALKLIQSGKVDMMRLRSRFIVGEQFDDVKKYTRYFKPQQIHPNFVEFEKIQKTVPFLKYLRPLKAKRMSVRSLFIENNTKKKLNDLGDMDCSKLQRKSGNKVFILENNPAVICRN